MVKKKKVTLEEDVPLSSITRRKDGSIRLIAECMSSEYLDKEWLGKFAEQTDVKLWYRHRDPDTEFYSDETALGEVEKCEVDGERVLGSYIMSGDTPLQKLRQEQVMELFKNNKTVGISPQFWIYYKSEKQEEIEDIEVIEHSITHLPRCETCTIEAIQMEKDKENKEIRKLEAELKKAKENLGKKQEKLESLRDELDEEKTEKKTMEQKVDLLLKNSDSLKKQLNCVKQSLEKEKEKRKQMEKRPIIEKIMEYDADENMLEFYETCSKEWLEKRLEKVKENAETSTPIVEAMEETRKDDIEEMEKDEDEEENLKFESIDDVPDDELYKKIPSLKRMMRRKEE